MAQSQTLADPFADPSGQAPASAWPSSSSTKMLPSSTKIPATALGTGLYDAEGAAVHQPAKHHPAKPLGTGLYNADGSPVANLSAPPSSAANHKVYSELAPP